MKTAMCIAAILFATIIAYAKDDSEKYSDLEKRISELEERVSDMEKALGGKFKADSSNKAKPKNIAEIKKEALQKAKQRRLQDLSVYSRAEIDEIEGLYQDAKRNLRSRKSQKSLKKMTQKYKRANRTGCAILLLAEVSKGRKKESYLQEAAKEYHDCYFGNGVHIGPWARYLLANYYRKNGKTKKAEELLAEIKEKYPNAIDKRGVLLVP